MTDDIPTQRSETLFNLDATEAARSSLIARYNLPDNMQAMADAKRAAGWIDLRGDCADLPAEVSATVERHAAEHEGRTSADYMVSYRYNPLPDDTDAYDVMVTPALFTLGEDGLIGIEVDQAQQLREQLGRIIDPFVQAADAIGESMQKVAEAAVPAAAALRAWCAPLSVTMGNMFKGFGRIVYMTDGLPPGPVVDEASARTALAYAESTMVLRRPPKRSRRGAKRAYLTVKRHLPTAERRALRKVPMRQFGAF
jgi:hypothetical protein